MLPYKILWNITYAEIWSICYEKKFFEKKTQAL